MSLSHVCGQVRGLLVAPIEGDRGSAPRTQVEDERDRTIVTQWMEANNQSPAPSFIPADGRIPSVFLGSLTTKFREYQNSAYAPPFT